MWGHCARRRRALRPARLSRRVLTPMQDWGGPVRSLDASAARRPACAPGLRHAILNTVTARAGPLGGVSGGRKESLRGPPLTRFRWPAPPHETDPARVQADVNPVVIVESDSAAARRRKAARRLARAKAKPNALTQDQGPINRRPQPVKPARARSAESRAPTPEPPDRGQALAHLNTLERRFAKALRRERAVLARTGTFSDGGGEPSDEQVSALRSSEAQLRLNREHHERAWRHAYLRHHGRAAPAEPKLR